jgi:hypothetical protein
MHQTLKPLPYFWREFAKSKCGKIIGVAIQGSLEVAWLV